MAEQLTIIRSDRKTLGLEVRRDGTVYARAPWHMPKEQILAFAASKSAWIAQKRAQFALRRQNEPVVARLSFAELQALGEQAKDVIYRRAVFYAKQMNVQFTGLTIRNQRTRWGSCSVKGRLNFNCLLMLTPPEVIDSVVVHELCHLKELNHSAKFYEEVLRVFPDYYKWDAWLKENGSALMQRMTG